MPELAYLKIRTISIQVRDTEPTQAFLVGSTSPTYLSAFGGNHPVLEQQTNMLNPAYARINIF